MIGANISAVEKTIAIEKRDMFYFGNVRCMPFVSRNYNGVNRKWMLHWVRYMCDPTVMVPYHINRNNSFKDEFFLQKRSLHKIPRCDLRLNSLRLFELYREYNCLSDNKSV